MIGHRSNPKDWKVFQRRLKAKTRRKHFASRGVLLLAYILLISASYAGSRILANGEIEAGAAVARRGHEENIGSERLIKQDLPALISPLNLDLNPSDETQFLVVNDQEKLKVEVSLNAGRQTYILKLLRLC